MSLFRAFISLNIGRNLNSNSVILRPVVIWSATGGNRFIFSTERLGIENYKRMRHEYDSKMGLIRDNFLEKVNKHASKDNPVVYTSDLKALVHLAETNEDISLLRKMLRVHCTSLPRLTFGQFNFGPVVMRLLYTLNDAQTAMQLFCDTELQQTGFFDQMSSRKVLLQLLFDHDMYDEVYYVMDNTINKQITGISYPSDCLMLTLAACLKQNTSESYKKMLQYVNGARECKNTIPHRGVLHATYLALKQGHVTEAGAILEQMPPLLERKHRPQGDDNIRLLYYARSSQIRDIFSLLKEIILPDVPTFNSLGFEIFQHVFDECKTAVIASGNKEDIHNMEEAENRLMDGSHLVDVHLDQFLFRKIISSDNHKHKRNILNKKKQFTKGRNLGFVDVTQYN